MPRLLVLGQQLAEQDEQIVIVDQLALALRRLVSLLKLAERIQMIGKVTEFFDHDVVQAAQRVLGLAEHLRDRPLAREPLVLFVEP